MDTIDQVSLLISILLNFLILGLVSLWIYSKGGISYIIRKAYFLRNIASSVDSMEYNPYYWDKKSHFETLPKSESDIVFLGDSLTDSCEWQERFREARIKNRGISGDTTNNLLNRIDEVIQSKPKKIFIMIGINDVNRGIKVNDIVANHKLILKLLKEKIPQTQVLIQSILPINYQISPHKEANEKVIKINEKLRKTAQEFSYQYIDLFSAFLDNQNQLDAQYTTDGIHLNGQGYLLWQKIIEKDVVN